MQCYYEPIDTVWSNVDPVSPWESPFRGNRCFIGIDGTRLTQNRPDNKCKQFH